MPFYGVYAAVTGQGFAGTVQWRHNNFDMNLNNADLGLSNTALNASGNTFSADAAYTFPLAYNFFATPSAAVFVSNTQHQRPLPVALGRARHLVHLRQPQQHLVEGGVADRDGLRVQRQPVVLPYVSGDFWHEFDGTTTTRFYQLPRPACRRCRGSPQPASGHSGSSAIGFSTSVAEVRLHLLRPGQSADRLEHSRLGPDRRFEVQLLRRGRAGRSSGAPFATSSRREVARPAR